jgi:hypothetical protein
MLSLLHLDSRPLQKCTFKVGALKAQIRLVDAEIVNLINDIAELEDRRGELERQEDGLREQLALLAGQEESGQ